MQPCILVMAWIRFLSLRMMGRKQVRCPETVFDRPAGWLLSRLLAFWKTLGFSEL